LAGDDLVAPGDLFQQVLSFDLVHLLCL
jgi:hypothetical protein